MKTVITQKNNKKSNIYQRVQKKYSFFEHSVKPAVADNPIS